MPRHILLLASVAAILALGATATAQAESGGSTGVTKSKPPSTVFKARIGWFYNDNSAFPQTHAGPLVLHWAPCAKAGGVQIAFPTGAHLYEGENGGFSVKKPPIALLSGPPLNPSDPFKAILYVGDLAQPGTKTLTVKCRGLVKGKLHTLFSGPLKTEYVRKDVNFNPPGSFTARPILDFLGTEPEIVSVLNRSCAEPGTPSITLSSPALATPFATLPLSDTDGAFKGLVKPSTEEPRGEYETVVSCGSGRVGVGIIGVL